MSLPPKLGSPYIGMFPSEGAAGRAAGVSAVSLFAGSGGLDLGFTRAGFHFDWVNEISIDAAATHEAMLGGRVLRGDIWELLSQVPRCDVLVGGPPCQAFSLVGKRIDEDPRGKLVWAFLEAVRLAEPKVFVMENVTGITASKIDGRPLPDMLVERFEQMGYRVHRFTLNAADYGVPQRRRRIVMIGIRSMSLFRMIEPATFLERIGFPQEPTAAADALSDLPLNPAYRAVDIANPDREGFSRYLHEPRHPFQSYVREHSGEQVTLHLAPTMSERDREYVRHIPPGGNYRSIPDWLDTPRIARIKLTGGRTTTYGRLHPRQPAYTINTYFNRPNVGANYHYQADRLITAREALRLQSFPDWFTPRFTSQRSLHMQIGNAVPPLLAYAIALSVRFCLFDDEGLAHE